MKPAKVQTTVRLSPELIEAVRIKLNLRTASFSTVVTAAFETIVYRDSDESGTARS